MMATSIGSGEDSTKDGLSCEIHNEYGGAIVEFLHLPKGRNENNNNNKCEETIAYIRSRGDAPTVIFCNGFHSEMSGRKATELEKHCRSKGRSFVRFDYRGMGLSSGNVNDMVLGDWVADTLAVIDSLSSHREEKVLLVGSSMGGWIALHAAMQRPDQVVGVVGVAVAPDFVRYHELELTEEQRADYERTGCMYITSEYSEDPYTISNKFADESRNWNLLDAADAEIPVRCPVRLLHGKRDSAVPWQRAVALSNEIPKSLVQLNLIDDGDHRLSNDENIASILSTVEELLRGLGFNECTKP